MGYKATRNCALLIAVSSALAWPGAEAVVTSLGRGAGPAGTISGVKLLGYGTLRFKRDETGLRVWMPGSKMGDYVHVLEIKGLKLK